MDNNKRMNPTSTIVVDTSLLPTWPVIMAMNFAYSEAQVRLQNILSLTEYEMLPEFGYKFHVNNPTTGERRVVVQRGGESSTEAAVISWEMAISILAIIRLKDYVAAYGESSTIGLFFSFGGDEKQKSDMDRLMLLFEERPEFSILNLSHDLEKNVDEDVAEKKAPKEEEEAPEIPPAEGYRWQ